MDPLFCIVDPGHPIQSNAISRPSVAMIKYNYTGASHIQILIIMRFVVFKYSQYFFMMYITNKADASILKASRTNDRMRYFG